MEEKSQRTPGRPRSEASRTALLDAAYWQVLDHGYDSVTSEMIAKAAGAGKQTLYRWWRSKGLLVLEAFVEKARARIDRPRESACRAGNLERFLVADLAALRPFSDVLRGLLSEASADTELANVLRAAVLKPREDSLRDTLSAGSYDPRLRGALVDAIEGAIMRRIMLREALDELFARQLTAIACLR